MPQQNIILKETLDGLGSPFYDGWLAHAFCLAGRCDIVFNGVPFEFAAGDVLIIRRGDLVGSIEPSADFRVEVIYVTASFIELCTPQNNYGMKGQLALFLNPVMRLTPEQQRICQIDFEIVQRRFDKCNHRFYRDMMMNAVQMLILDFFDFHSTLYGEDSVSAQNASIMQRFLQLLEDGHYRKSREVSYFADILCITPKYLSEISKRVSGYAANYWINRYTALDISRLLKDKSLSFVDISDMFGFSSPAYFSRYVQRHLGVNPSVYRE